MAVRPFNGHNSNLYNGMSNGLYGDYNSYSTVGADYMENNYPISYGSAYYIFDFYLLLYEWNNKSELGAFVFH